MPTVDLDAGPLHYVERGDGPAVVLLHGLLMNHTLWDPVLDLLPDGSHLGSVGQLDLDERGCDRRDLLRPGAGLTRGDRQHSQQGDRCAVAQRPDPTILHWTPLPRSSRPRLSTGRRRPCRESPVGSDSGVNGIHGDASTRQERPMARVTA